jgi:hypothetical protein
MDGEVGVYNQVFLTWALVGGEVVALAILPQEKEPLVSIW